MRKLILRWVALAVFLSLLAYAFVLLGEWQLSRLDERRDRNTAVSANRDEPVVPYSELMGRPVPDADQWRRVSLTGSYSGEQYQVRYRNQGGNPGIEVAAVFTTDSGDVVLVDRGFIAREQGKPDTEVLPTPPTGTVSVVGYLRGDEKGDDTATVPHDFKVRLIDAESIGASLGRPLLPGYVSLVSSEPSNGAELAPIEPPSPTEGNHFSYALQWFAFSVIAVVGIAVLIRADLQDRKKAKARAARKARVEAAAATQDVADGVGS